MVMGNLRLEVKVQEEGASMQWGVDVQCGYVDVDIYVYKIEEKMVIRLCDKTV